MCLDISIGGGISGARRSSYSWALIVQNNVMYEYTEKEGWTKNRRLLKSNPTMPQFDSDLL